MKFLVFGGTGFLGKTIVEGFASLGHEVVSVGRKLQENNLDNVSPVQLDISKKKDFLKLNFSPDAVINCASKIPEAGKTSKDVDFVNQVLQSNVLGALNIANWTAENKVDKIFNCSTLATVSKPWPVPLNEDYVNLPTGNHTAYGMSKLFQEQIMNEALKGTSSKILHLRLSAVYGMKMNQEGILFHFLDKLEKGKPIQITDGLKTKFDFINSQDIAKTILKLSHKKIDSGIANLASGKPVSLIELINFLADSIKKERPEIENTNTKRESYPSQIGLKVIEHYLEKGFNNDFIPLNVGLEKILK